MNKTLSISDSSSPWFDRKRAAAHLAISPSSLDRLVRRPNGPRAARLGPRLLRFHVRELDAYARKAAARWRGKS